MIGGRHRPNMEFVASGCGERRDAVLWRYAGDRGHRSNGDERQGRRPHTSGRNRSTRLAVLLITLAFGAWAEIIPLATLAGILLVVAYRMIEWRVFRAELRGPEATLRCS